MIKLSGLQLIDEKNQNGDIEIKFIGLRSGEKLYEELVKDSNYSLSTHPLIYKCKEKVLDYNMLLNVIEDLTLTIDNNSLNDTLNILTSNVEGFKKNDKLLNEK